MLSSASSSNFPFYIGYRLTRKSNNMVVFPLPFHIALQQPFKSLWSCLLLFDNELSRESFVLCLELLLMSLPLASKKFLLEFPSPRHFSLSVSYSLDLSDLGDRTCSTNPVRVRFSAPVQTSHGAHPASYTMGTGSFSGVKRPGHGVDHPPPSTAKVEGRVELHICSPSGPSWPVLG